MHTHNNFLAAFDLINLRILEDVHLFNYIHCTRILAAAQKRDNNPRTFILSTMCFLYQTGLSGLVTSTCNQSQLTGPEHVKFYAAAFRKHWCTKLQVGSEDPHLMQPSKEPGRKGTPWPMSPSSRSPSVSRSKAASTWEEGKVWVLLIQTGVVGGPVISATGRLRQEHPMLGTGLGYMARPDLNQKSNLAVPYSRG